MRFGNPRWLFAVARDGLVAVGGETEIEIAFDAALEDRLAVLAALSTGLDAATLAARSGVEQAACQDLLDDLARRGALLEDPSSEDTDASAVPLLDAALAANGGGDVPRVVATADEALVLPPALDRERSVAALRAFAAGLEPPQRLAAYGTALRLQRPAVWGDRPEPRPLAAALDEPSGGAIVVLDLKLGARVTVASLEDLDAREPHRLGPVRAVARQHHPALDEYGAELFSAWPALSNLSFADPRADWTCHGLAASAADAELVARAEAVERFAAGDLGGRELVRAAADDLDGAVPTDELWRANDRQLADHASIEAYDAAARYLWTPARSVGGAPRWLPAEAALFPFRDNARERRVAETSSSGVAAHDDTVRALDAALCELLERDAFMWTWVQHVSRERLDPSGLDAATRRRIDQVRRAGYEVAFVNLTLETLPVVLCALHDERGVQLGAACRPDGRAAARKALDEAAWVLWRPPGELGPVPDAKQVRTPAEHLRLHWGRRGEPIAAFLYAGGEALDFDDLQPGGKPVAAVQRELGDVIVLDLSSRSTRPFAVVRAVVPGLVPISFGWDREPLGMPRLAQVKRTRDGRTVGRELDLATAGPLTPHPFP